MKKIAYCILAALLLAACQNDDTDFSAYTTDTGVITTIYLTYNGSTVSVAGDSQGVVSVSNADVTVNSQYADSLLLVLSGNTTDGSLLVNRNRKFGILLNGADITNADGPAINNQCKKALYIACASGTVNTLTDGTEYADAPLNADGESIDQKGTLFSEGQLFFSGGGTLNVNGNSKNAIASDDYIVVVSDITINAVTSVTGSNGIKANDGVYVNGGTLNVSVASTAGRGIRSEADVIVTGGTTTVSTTGDCEYDEEEQDYSSAACIKCDGAFAMSGGIFSMISAGDGGKGINATGAVTVSGGTFSAVTTGSNNDSKPKAVKSDTSITVSGGTFYAKTNKSWACDNGYDDDSLSDDELALLRITVEGSPATKTITKKEVNIMY